MNVYIVTICGFKYHVPTSSVEVAIDLARGEWNARNGLHAGHRTPIDSVERVSPAVVLVPKESK